MAFFSLGGALPNIKLQNHTPLNHGFRRYVVFVGNDPKKTIGDNHLRNYEQASQVQNLNRTILLMEEILHHLGCIKPYK